MGGESKSEQRRKVEREKEGKEGMGDKGDGGEEEERKEREGSKHRDKRPTRTCPKYLLPLARPHLPKQCQAWRPSLTEAFLGTLQCQSTSVP